MNRYVQKSQPKTFKKTFNNSNVITPRGSRIMSLYGEDVITPEVEDPEETSPGITLDDYVEPETETETETEPETEKSDGGDGNGDGNSNGKSYAELVAENENNKKTALENLKSEYDENIKFIDAEQSDAITKLEESKKSGLEASAIAYEKLMKYLPDLAVRQKVNDTGIRGTLDIEANADYMNNRNRINELYNTGVTEANASYDRSKSALDSGLAANKLSIEQAYLERGDRLRAEEQARQIAEEERVRDEQDSNYLIASNTLQNSNIKTAEEAAALLAQYEGKVSAEQYAALQSVANAVIERNVREGEEDLFTIYDGNVQNMLAEYADEDFMLTQDEATEINEYINGLNLSDSAKDVLRAYVDGYDIEKPEEIANRGKVSEARLKKADMTLKKDGENFRIKLNGEKYRVETGGAVDKDTADTLTSDYRKNTGEDPLPGIILEKNGKLYVYTQESVNGFAVRRWISVRNRPGNSDYDDLLKALGLSEE